MYFIYDKIQDLYWKLYSSRLTKIIKISLKRKKLKRGVVKEICPWVTRGYLEIFKTAIFEKPKLEVE